MIHSKNICFLIIFTYFISCSKDENISVNSSDIEIEPYDGTYLLKDRDCSGNDIQYLTIYNGKISIFDYLGDICDDTANCYSSDVFLLI